MPADSSTCSNVPTRFKHLQQRTNEEIHARVKLCASVYASVSQTDSSALARVHAHALAYPDDFFSEAFGAPILTPPFFLGLYPCMMHVCFSNMREEAQGAGRGTRCRKGHKVHVCKIIIGLNPAPECVRKVWVHTHDTYLHVHVGGYTCRNPFLLVS